MGHKLCIKAKTIVALLKENIEEYLQELTHKNLRKDTALNIREKNCHWNLSNIKASVQRETN